MLVGLKHTVFKVKNMQERQTQQTSFTGIALYKGLPDKFLYIIFHFITCFFLSIRKLQLVKHSHAELCIDGICYSSSVRDKGVRTKFIDLNSGKWDLIELNLSEEEKNKALSEFVPMINKSYDFLGAIGVVINFIKDAKDKFLCFEVVARMLGMQNPSKVTPIELIEQGNKMK